MPWVVNGSPTHPMEPIEPMWTAVGQFGLVLAGCLLCGVLAWRWRGRRAWRREQELKRQWAETLEQAEAFMARRMEEARAEHAAEIEALRNGRPTKTRARAASVPEPRPEATPKQARRPSRKRRKPATGSRGANGSNGTAGSHEPDDLKQIRGVGRVFEAKLHDLGYRTFLDIARWGPADIEQVTNGLDTSVARIERDGWVAQARELHERLHGRS